MADLIVPHSFAPNTTARSADVNDNFNAIEDYVNTAVLTTDNRPRIILFRELSALGPNFNIVEGSVGLIDGAVTLPTLTAPNYLSMEFFIPRVVTSSYSGGLPRTGGLMEYRLKINGVTNAIAQATIATASNTDPTGSVFGKRLWTTATAPAGSVTMQITGKIAGVSADQGQARLDGSGGVRPYFLIQVI